MRNLVIAAAVLALAVPLVGGAQEGGNQADGWETRLDRGTDATSVLHFRTMGTGLHAVGGNCKFPIRGNRKPHTLVVGGLCPAFHDVGESNSEGAGGKCTDGRRGCC